MSLGNSPDPSARQLPHEAPPADKWRLVAAGILVLIPIVALMWVGSYNRENPTLWGFPFFIWYQFLWVFICSAMTWTAYKVLQNARRRPDPGDAAGGTSEPRP